MKTVTFQENYAAIKFFCDTATEGFVVAETNSEITKKEFIEQLSEDFSIRIQKLDSLSISDFQLNSNDILVVDEFDTVNSSQTVIDLNYNRNWLLNLHKVIVLVLRPSTVNELIRYSSSFWSFVTLHKVFSCGFKGIIQPHFIDSNTTRTLNGLVKYKSYSIDKNTSHRVLLERLVFSCFHEKFESKRLDEFLKMELEKVDESNQNDIANFILKVLNLADRLRQSKLCIEAKLCIDFIDKSFTIYDRYSEMEIRKLKLLSEIYYDLEFFDKALYTYELLIVAIERMEEKDLLEIASIVNNIGVIYYKKDAYSDALDCYYSAIKKIDSSEDVFVTVNLLFNLSLLHYDIKDYYNALYYINTAIDRINEYGLSRESVLLSKCKVLKAYLVINLGNLKYATDLLTESLSLLREQLDENCTYIMEIHYVFAVLYLHKNELERAERCAKKAYSIMKRENPSMSVRCHIRELLGEIYFYQGNYPNALIFLKIAYRHGTKNQVFNEDVLYWIRAAIEQCENN